MIRDPEHTPSPQSVVVPVEPEMPLPCPFCGCKVAEAGFWFAKTDTPPMAYVFCLECSDTEATDGPKRETLEGAITAWNRRAAPAPSSLAGGEVDDRLHGAIGKLKAWVDLIQQGKRGEAVSGNPIVDCVNDLPAIVRQLEAAELEIEGAFERYEDAALSPEAPALDQIGCAELEVGRAVYERIEKLIDATTGPEAEELSYLAHLAASVEEVGGYDGPEAPAREPEGKLDAILAIAKRPNLDIAGFMYAMAEIQEVCDSTLTPRHEAPASDEVSKQRDEAIRIAKRLHDTVESLIYGLPKYLNDTAQTDEENMIGKAWHVFDAAAYGLAALPEVEPVQDLHELPQSVHEAPAWTTATEAAWAENNSHEAPASRLTDTLNGASAKVAENPERAAEIRANWTDGHEAPAEGTGKRTLADCLDACSGDHASAWKMLTGATDADLSEARRLIEAERSETGIYEYLLTSKPFTFGKYVDRARSSAPEAREGEGMAAWRWRKRSDAVWNYQEARQVIPGAICEPLYTHPAAPSADKLRIAVEAMLPVARSNTRLGKAGAELRAHLDAIDQALAALKAEGAK